ncbi:uncharacterized protein VICG_00041 [Vittaforma corneae ATCC 50505]|uniref:Uncharacterized protein n=1 Tax=Vittaforma corneae (strain ATCC 50505) TaxID=993615 RepID=L2GPG9_VITCO|nr:uncharacterized protein VICG_00041 [Vittaforma corneae ATCC 50505]ELA42726.1 hypothetical protein VICG_00041 [Vittaforma corneae ATCC 50505]
MQKQKLEILPQREILKSLENAFNVIPIVPRDCIKAINKLVYNMNQQNFSQEVYKNVLFLVLRAFTSKDNYLKSVVYSLLEMLSTKTFDGLLGINSIIKDIDDKHTPVNMRNSALRVLFSNLPLTMRFEFEKLIKTALLDNKTRDNAVCISSEYFKDMKVDSRIFDKIDDYHLSFFNRLPINRYTSMLEIRRIVKNNEDVHKISQYLTTSTDSTTFFEAAKALTVIRQEMAAPMIDKAVSTIRVHLKKGPIEQFASMKILNKLSVLFPTKVAKANREIEDLVHVNSRTVSMLAILTLLKTGTDETARQLSSKLEPLMSTMSEPYKIMAIETIEKLTRNSKSEYLAFLKASLFDKGSIEFKRFILKKVEPLLADSDECQKEVMKFLCSYVEDPEYYQISMDILGLISQYILNSKDLIRVYNRLILDNIHVRNSACQALFDLSDKFDTLEALDSIQDQETMKIRSFLYSNADIKKGRFDINELGDLRDEVLKYLAAPIEEPKEGEALDDRFIKECRSIPLTPEGSDFSVAVIKKMFKDSVVLLFTFENKMSRIVVNSCLLTIDTGAEKHSIELSHTEFKDTTTATRELEVSLKKGDVVNGVFEYQISPEDELTEVENDSISLIPFDINVLDYIRPVVAGHIPTNKRMVESKFKLKQTEAISRIVGVCNMFLTADKDSFELQGCYEDIPVVLRGNAVYSKYTTVYLEILCDNSHVVDEIVAVLD